jgi:vitamin B12/bleomycin/antimicrobial peptide transport system ATP-binding/permease protein
MDNLRILSKIISLNFMNRLRFNKINQLKKWYWLLAYPYWLSAEKWKAFGILLAIILLLASTTSLDGSLNKLGGDFITALSNRESGKFYQLLLLNVAFSIVFLTLKTLEYFALDKLGLYWRQWLTEYFLGSYCKKDSFYQTNNNPDIDNPDQRISEDIETFIDQNYLIINLIETTIRGFLFIGILASINRYLVLFAFIAAIIEIVFSFIIGRVLTSLNYQNLKRQADFRYSLIQSRIHNESIALYGGEEREFSSISRLFTAAMDILHRMILPKSTLRVFGQFTSAVFGLIVVLILAPGFFRGEISIGDVTRSGTAFSSVLSSFTWIAENFQNLSLFAVVIKRLGKLQDSFHQQNSVAESYQSNTISLDSLEQKNRFDFVGVTLQTPDGKRTLIEDLSVTVAPESSMLITGDSGIGKSSLVKAIAGLWNTGTGCIVRPKLEEIFFLPQRPYFVIGSLREQMLYPQSNEYTTTQELQQILIRANFENLMERVGGLDTELDWYNILSLGEQQKLAFARLLLSKKKYAVLDESTSALDIESEKYLYQLLQDSDLTYISVGHRQTLIPYHQRVLKLVRNAEWETMSSEEYRKRSGISF